MNTSKEVILDAANSMVQQLRIELDSLTKERDQLRKALKSIVEVSHMCHVTPDKMAHHALVTSQAALKGETK